MSTKGLIHPFCCPDATTSCRWLGESIIWTINGEDVSDRDLRKWCYLNLEYPWCYVGPSVQKLHVNAYAARPNP